jgi:hypothetical protein
MDDELQAARRESRVFSLIDSFEITSPTAYLPVEVDIPEVLFVSENTANNSSEYTTVKTGSQRVQHAARRRERYLLAHQRLADAFGGDDGERVTCPLSRARACGCSTAARSQSMSGLICRAPRALRTAAEQTNTTAGAFRMFARFRAR